MHNRNAWKILKVSHVERKKMCDVVRLHHRDKARVMRSLALDVLRGDEVKPIRENIRSVIKQGELIQQALYL